MKITVIGTGAFGIALANNLASNGHSVSMWSKFEEEIVLLLLDREHKDLLPDIKIEDSIELTSDLEKALENTELILFAIPIKAVTEVSHKIKPYYNNCPIVLVTKGLLEKKRLSEVVEEILNTNKVCMLSGPSFAIDVAKKFPVGLMSASKNEEIAKLIKEVFQNKSLNVAVTTDILGVEMCACIKNIFAIITGMFDEDIESTKAMLLTNLINEYKDIIEKFGGKTETAFCYAGIGDFLLTCMNNKSRNYTFGKIYSKLNDENKVYEEMGLTTVEGVRSLKEVKELLDSENITVYSIDLLYDIIYGDKDALEIYNLIKG